MKTYIVTGFDSNYLNWAMSFLISAKFFANHNDIIIVTNSSTNLDKLKNLYSEFVLTNGDIKKSTIDFIIERSKIENANFIYWDADVYFQDSINELIEKIDNNILISENRNSGFIAASSKEWQYIGNIKNMVSQILDNEDLYECIYKYFNNKISIVDNTWNYTSVHDLKFNGKVLTDDGFIPKTVHPSGDVKKQIINKNILFWEVHNSLFNRFKSPIKKKILINEKFKN